MGFPRQEYWNELLSPSPDPGIKPASPALAGRFFTPEPLGKPKDTCYCHTKCSLIITHNIIFNKSNPFDDFKDSLSSFLLAFQLLLNLTVLVLGFFSILFMPNPITNCTWICKISPLCKNYNMLSNFIRLETSHIKKKKGKPSWFICLVYKNVLTFFLEGKLLVT